MLKEPNPIDIHVGSRVRMRRMMIGMSQQTLGTACGLTFQQIQKYEKGTNRIGASRLQQMARALEVPASFFFDGSPDAPTATGPIDDPLAELGSTADGIALAKAFIALGDVKKRRAVVDFLERMAA